MAHFNDVLDDLRFIEAHEDEIERKERERELRRHSEPEIDAQEFGGPYGDHND